MVNFHFPMVEIPFPYISSPKPQSVDSQSGPLARLQVLQNNGSQMFSVRAPSQTPSAPKQWKSDVLVKN